MDLKEFTKLAVAGSELDKQAMSRNQLLRMIVSGLASRGEMEVPSMIGRRTIKGSAKQLLRAISKLKLRSAETSLKVHPLEIAPDRYVSPQAEKWIGKVVSEAKKSMLTKKAEMDDLDRAEQAFDREEKRFGMPLRDMMRKYKTGDLKLLERIAKRNKRRSNT